MSNSGGEIDKYGWVDVGSSFLPSDVISAFLFAQIENLDDIQQKRKSIWNAFYWQLKELEDSGHISLPFIPEFATNNAHMFYIVCHNLEERTELLAELKAENIVAVFHYLSLHKSPYYSSRHDGRILPNSDRFSDCLLRLPLFYELTDEMIERIALTVKNFFKS